MKNAVAARDVGPAITQCNPRPTPEQELIAAVATFFRGFGELFAVLDAELSRLSAATAAEAPQSASEPRIASPGDCTAVPRARALMSALRPLVTGLAPVPKSTVHSVAPPRHLSELHEAYLAEEHADIVSSSLASRRATLRFFVEVAGDRPLADYTREHAAEFRRQLPRLPKDAGRHFPGMTDVEAIEAAPVRFPCIRRPPAFSSGAV